jgi:acyl carrier protein
VARVVTPAALRGWLAEAVADLARPRLAPAAVVDTTPLLDLLDSAAVLELVVRLEETLGVTFAADEVGPEQLGTFARLLAFVAARC